MMTPVKILVVEDEMIIAAKISMHLEQLGYEVSGIVPRGEDAITHCQHNAPDILLMDINLKGSMNGIETAQAIQEDMNLPVVYLTANADEATFELAKSTRPYAFITKPYKKVDLQRAIALVVARMQEDKGNDAVTTDDTEMPYLLKDRIFIRQQESMVKLFLSDISYIEADRSYCTIVTDKAQHLLSVPLKKLEDKLPKDQFFRLHRSYVINLERIDEVAQNHVVVGRKSIPIGKAFKDHFLQSIRSI